MVRLVVSAWLVVATFFGPWLCCCTVSAFIRSAVSHEQTHCTCHQKAAEREQPNHSRPDHNHHHDHDHDSCPCKHSIAKVAVVPQSASAGVESSPLSYVNLLPVGGVDVLTARHSIYADRRGGPPLSADVLLHVFHNLRC
jgi:hypothetical protein